MKNLRLVLLLLCSSFLGFNSFAQCDSTATLAAKALGQDYISDGQVYRALLFEDQEAEFHTTFFGGSNYRISSYLGLVGEQLVFTLEDTDGNVLFSNADHGNSVYWDFEFEHTIDAKVKAHIDLTKQKSGCAVLLIGFER